MTSDSDVDALCLDKNQITLHGEAQNNTQRTDTNSQSDGWTFYILLAAVVCCIGSAVPAGYNIGVMNNAESVIRGFLNRSILERYSIELNEEQLDYCWSSIISIFLIGGVAGSLAAGYLADRYGRKSALIIGNIFGVFGGLFFYLIKSTNALELFWLGRILVGISGGLATSLVPMYMTEVAPLKLRGAVGVLCQLGLTIGVLASQSMSLDNILGTENLWNVLVFIFAPICFIAAILTIKLPESPKYLYVVKGDQALARRELSRLRNKDILFLQNEIDCLEQEAAISASADVWTLSRVLKSRELRLPLILMCTLQAGQQLSGINSVFYFSKSIFMDANLSENDAQYTTLGTGVANVVMAVISGNLLSHFSRRKLFLSSCYSSNLCLISLCIAIQLNGYVFMRWIAVISMITYVFTYGLGLGPIPYFIGSELFEVGPRPSAMALGSMCNWGGNFLVGMFFQIIVGYIGSFTFLIFVTFTTFVALFVNKYLPETFGKTTTEVSKMMAHGFQSKSPA